LESDVVTDLGLQTAAFGDHDSGWLAITATAEVVALVAGVRGSYSSWTISPTFHILMHTLCRAHACAWWWW